MKKKSNKIVLVILFLCGVLLIAVSFLIFGIEKKSEEYTLTNDAFQFYGGTEHKLCSGSVIKMNNEGKAILTGGLLESEVGTLPVYYKDKQEVLLANEMIYYAPRSIKCASTKPLSILKYKENGNVFLLSDGKEIMLENGFIYDGKDTYLFLEPMTLKFDNYTYELSSMSYVELDPKNYISVFDRKTGEMVIETPKFDATVYSCADDYNVNLYNDSMQLYDGTKILLFNDSSKLELIH